MVKLASNIHLNQTPLFCDSSQLDPAAVRASCRTAWFLPWRCDSARGGTEHGMAHRRAARQRLPLLTALALLLLTCAGSPWLAAGRPLPLVASDSDAEITFQRLRANVTGTYFSNDELQDFVLGIASQCSAIMSAFQFGTSAQGTPLLALDISSTAGERCVTTCCCAQCGHSGQDQECACACDRRITCSTAPDLLLGISPMVCTFEAEPCCQGRSVQAWSSKHSHAAEVAPSRQLI